MLFHGMYGTYMLGIEFISRVREKHVIFAPMCIAHLSMEDADRLSVKDTSPGLSTARVHGLESLHHHQQTGDGGAPFSSGSHGTGEDRISSLLGPAGSVVSSRMVSSRMRASREGKKGKMKGHLRGRIGKSFPVGAFTAVGGRARLRLKVKRGDTLSISHQSHGPSLPPPPPSPCDLGTALMARVKLSRGVLLLSIVQGLEAHRGGRKVEAPLSHPTSTS